METAAFEKVVDQRTFWRLVGQRAVGVSIVTAADAAGPAGFLGLSATHLSADPPLMMVSVDHRTSALTTIEAAGHFAINYLPKGAANLADIFGGKAGVSGAARFEHGSWTAGSTGAPTLAGAVCTLECRTVDRIAREGVTIVIGRVVDFHLTTVAEPLIAFQGSYIP
jgi:flavin reductase (DIM6/NTAB) family NADH-FMN oxidoreductase RutF